MFVARRRQAVAMLVACMDSMLVEGKMSGARVLCSRARSIIRLSVVCVLLLQAVPPDR